MNDTLLSIGEDLISSRDSLTWYNDDVASVCQHYLNCLRRHCRKRTKSLPVTTFPRYLRTIRLFNADLCACQVEIQVQSWDLPYPAKKQHWQLPVPR